jgi:hypothetical protein
MVVAFAFVTLLAFCVYCIQQFKKVAFSCRLLRNSWN